MRVQFSLRDLVWLFVVIGLVIALWLAKAETHKAQEEARKAQEKCDTIQWDTIQYLHLLWAPLEEKRKELGLEQIPFPNWMLEDSRSPQAK